MFEEITRPRPKVFDLDRVPSALRLVESAMKDQRIRR